MHIPDAVLSPAVATATGLVGAGGLAVCLWRLRTQLGERTPVLMGTIPVGYTVPASSAPLLSFPDHYDGRHWPRCVRNTRAIDSPHRQAA